MAQVSGLILYFPLHRQSESSARVVNTLLTELDGLEPRKQVFVIGATNRPDILDPAMVRPGRLDKLLYVDLPTPEERIEILRAQTKRTPLSDDVNLELIARDVRCDGFSGADLSALVREAAVGALKEVFARVENHDQEKSAAASTTDDGMSGGAVGLSDDTVPVPEKILVEMKHFSFALSKVSPSVSISQRKRFAVLRAKFAGQPVGRGKEGREIVTVGPAGAEENTGGARMEEVTLT